MESFGAYFLNFHSPSMNLLGKLEEHIKSDYFFTNFVSSTRGTIYSLESILANTTGYPLISNNSKRFVKQPSSVAYPYKNAGYETIFITSGKINWRNINELLPSLYFDSLIGSNVICNDFPEAEEREWGVSDDFLYKEIMKILNEKSSKPKLICALTTQNHTPYDIPKHSIGLPLKIPDSLYNIIIANKEMTGLVFKSYQYSCNSLGEFMSILKTSSYANNTIVATTGDHNSYTLFPYEESQNQPMDKYAVPFYLYMPDIYKQNTNVNLKIAGSHKDIFPTIICNSLSNQGFFCVGENLLASSDSSIINFGDNRSFIYASPETSKEKVESKSIARRLLIDYYLSDFYLQNQIHKVKN